MIGRNLAPGLNRTFAAEAWPRAAGRAVGSGPAGGPRPGPARPAASGSSAPTSTRTRCSLARHHAEKAGVAARHPLPAARLRRLDQQAAVRLPDLQSALRRADGPAGRGRGPVPRHARGLPPPEDLVVLRPDGLSRVRGARRASRPTGGGSSTTAGSSVPTTSSTGRSRRRSGGAGSVEAGPWRRCRGRGMSTDCRGRLPTEPTAGQRGSTVPRADLQRTRPATARRRPAREHGADARHRDAARPSAACRPRPASRPRSSAAGWRSGRTTCAAGRRSWASPAIGSTSATSPRCRWWWIATRTACTSPSSTGRTSTRPPSTPTGST